MKIIEKIGQELYEAMLMIDGPLHILLDKPLMFLVKWAGYFLIVAGLYKFEWEMVSAGSLCLIALGTNSIAKMIFVWLEKNRNEKS